MTFNYKEYFRFIKPKTNLDIYDRFLFAFLSVHSTWESNIRGYELLKHNIWTSDSADSLRNKLIEARVGLYNHRTDYITQFSDIFVIKPKYFLKRKNESWIGYRNRLVNVIKGLGYAKVSFAIEMIYPNACWVTCIDTHIAQMFGIKQEQLNKDNYHSYEKQFLELAKKEKILPTQYRWQWWDNRQGYDSPRYWSYVLEN